VLSPRQPRRGAASRLLFDRCRFSGRTRTLAGTGYLPAIDEDGSAVN